MLVDRFTSAIHPSIKRNKHGDYRKVSYQINLLISLGLDLQCILLSAHILKARFSKMTYSALKNGKRCEI